jgi:TPR repeat protein
MNTRRSSISAADVTLRHILLSPYRCRDCRHRFWVISRNAHYLFAAIGIAFLAGAGAWSLRSAVDKPADDSDPTAQVSRQLSVVLKRAEAGDADAELDIATRYSHGFGVPKDEIEARKWLERAADHGSVDAKYEFGIALRDGRGAVQDYERAVKWIRLAAEAGHAQAQLALGNMYRVGTGVPLDNVKAYTWLNLASARGVADAAVFRDSALARLSPAEVVEAQAEARRLSETIPNARVPAR